MHRRTGTLTPFSSTLRPAVSSTTTGRLDEKPMAASCAQHEPSALAAPPPPPLASGGAAAACSRLLLALARPSRQAAAKARSKPAPGRLGSGPRPMARCARAALGSRSTGTARKRTGGRELQECSEPAAPQLRDRRWALGTAWAWLVPLASLSRIPLYHSDLAPLPGTPQPRNGFGRRQARLRPRVGGLSERALALREVRDVRVCLPAARGRGSDGRRRASHAHASRGVRGGPAQARPMPG